MFDPQEVMNKVQLKDYPQDWRASVVTIGRLEFIIRLVLFSIPAFIIGYVLAVLVVVLVFHIVPPSPFFWWILPLFTLIGGLLVLWLFVWLWIESSGRDSLFVLLPDGVVECFRGKKENMAFLRFDHIKKMDLDHQTTVRVDSEGSTSSTMAVWLNVYFQDGTFMKWNVPARYGDPIALGGTIVAAYEYFIQLQGQTQF